MEFPYEKDNKERIPFEHYLSEYQKLDPKEAVKRCGVEYDEERQQFHIRLMGYRYLVDFPEFAVHKEDEDEEGAFLLLDMVPAKIIVLRFLLSAQVVKSSGKYLTYREVPWGEVYFRQFEGRCLMRLKFGFGFKLDKFAEGMEKLPGVKSCLWETSPMSLSSSTAFMCASSSGPGTRSFRPLPRSCLRTISPTLTRRRIWRWWETFPLPL